MTPELIKEAKELIEKFEGRKYLDVKGILEFSLSYLKASVFVKNTI